MEDELGAKIHVKICWIKSKNIQIAIKKIRLKSKRHKNVCNKKKT